MLTLLPLKSSIGIQQPLLPDSTNANACGVTTQVTPVLTEFRIPRRVDVEAAQDAGAASGGRLNDCRLVSMP